MDHADVVGTSGGLQPWITEETPAAPDSGSEDAIVVEPRSPRTVVAAIVVLSLAVVAFVVVQAGTNHRRRSTLAQTPTHASATRTSPTKSVPSATRVPPVGGKALAAEASRLCRPAQCRVDVLDPPVLGWFEAAFPDAVEGDGYAAYDSAGLSVFATHLYLEHAVTVLCLGRRVRGRGATPKVQSKANAQVGASAFSTTLSVRREGWDVTITLLAGQRPTLASQSAKTWLKNAILP